MPTVSLFVKLFKSLIQQGFPSVRQFVLVAEPDRSIGGSTATISQVMSEKIPPPIHTVPLWADALGLTGAARQQFLDLAACAHLPPVTRGRFEEIITRYNQLEQDYENLHRKVAEMERHWGYSADDGMIESDG